MYSCSGMVREKKRLRFQDSHSPATAPESFCIVNVCGEWQQGGRGRRLLRNFARFFCENWTIEAEDRDRDREVKV